LKSESIRIDFKEYQYSKKDTDIIKNMI